MKQLLKRNFNWLQIYNSPFKPIIPKLYIGKLAIGTPYFFPRVAKLNRETRYYQFNPKRIGFDFVGLGYKTKWSRDDYRFEWNPIWSFVFFKWQIALTFRPKENDHYWECWLYYSRETDKSKSTYERLEQARKGFPCIWTTHYNGGEKKITCYWDIILKDKWVKLKKK